MTHQQKSYKKIDKSEIDLLCHNLSFEIEDILEYFGVEYYHKDNYLHGPCPVHGGDNPTAFTVYVDGDDMKGNWYCWTRQCEKEYQPTMLGLIRALMERQNDRKISFSEAVRFAKKFVKSSKEQNQAGNSERNRFTNSYKNLNRKKRAALPQVTPKQVRDKLSIPAKYYIERGYRSKTLDKYDVGLCEDKTKPMYNRIVVPVYDDDCKNMVGCVGRSRYNNSVPKWINSRGFNSGHYLYNYWFAQEEIRKTGVAILVEGQGDVWRLYESGIKNAVGLFGCKITDAQMIKLEGSGAMNLVILMDNDEAGLKAREKIKSKCERIFNIHSISLNEKYSDIGDMSVEEIQSNIKPLIEQITV